jgi:hypothetical protein
MFMFILPNCKLNPFDDSPEKKKAEEGYKAYPNPNNNLQKVSYYSSSHH